MTTENNQPVFSAGPRTGFPRRNFLRGIGFGGAAIAGGSLLSACGSSGTANTNSSAAAVQDMSDTDKTLAVANWPLYIDQKKVNGQVVRPSIQQFEAKTGIKVDYSESVNDNESFFATVRPELAAGKATPYDIFTLTDWMASKLITLGYLQKIDWSNVPNAKNLSPALKSPSWDPNRDYSLPWQSGMTGIAYDSAQVDAVTSINQLLTDPNLKGSVTALTEMRDTMGLVLLDQGADPSDFNQDDWDTAFAAIQKATDDQQIRQFTGNDYAQLLAKGDVKACMAWSGDVVQLQFDNPNIKFVIPDGGAMLWSDNMLIPIMSDHQKNAELWMNWYYDPKTAAEVTDWVNYISPVEGSKDILLKMDPSLAKNPLIYPSDADLAKTAIFMGLSADLDQKYTAQFETLFT
jgi:spermidine/putrescine transport system substrate-binding protein